ncbi:hypothetical protein GA0116948_101601 [Chitinophaga costaii]|uniref:Uncharacterized protein n=1 Tax=Chitinophaga costaii TaxID=1335309 RepID=A0A1C3ZXZ7_9BACT|nr:hypothetical protein [Chitinophaga costaii]SCB87191.1 hypothetical protein GA0116948_101601 [Chitinophaga costaii]
MSEISVLSNQYEQLVSTSDTVNNSVIALKKKNLLGSGNVQRKYPRLNVSASELTTAQTILKSFLENIIKLIREDAQESTYIPSIILDDYKKRMTKNQYLMEDLTELLERITKSQELEERHIAALDDILSILDSERSILFRKLRTARG